MTTGGGHNYVQEGTSVNMVKRFGLLRKNWKQQRMKFTMREMKTHPTINCKTSRNKLR